MNSALDSPFRRFLEVQAWSGIVCLSRTQVGLTLLGQRASAWAHWSNPRSARRRVTTSLTAMAIGGTGTTIPGRLKRLLLLSIGAALATITLKTLAWLLTGSVGLLSDAAESLVNLVAAVFALVVVYWAARPADEEHAYGHEKADYLSAGVEGALILLAAIGICYSAVGRLLNRQGISDVGVGLGVAIVASLINLAVARVLIAEGKRYRSVVLEADGRHLMTDVWTSAGVVVGVAAVALTGWERLDPIVALVVAGNIVATGVSLIRGFMGGLLDRALPLEERAEVERS
jgi:cation diffusion facilitator family transporter